MNSASRELVELAPGYSQPLIFDQSPSQTGSARPNQFGAGEFLRILRRRKYLIAAIVGLVLAATLFALSRTVPIYTTAAVLMVEPKDESAVTAPTMVAAGPDEELRIATKVELLQSRALARKVAQQLDLRSDPEFAPPPEEPGIIAQTLARLLPESSEDAAPQALSEEQIRNAELEAVTDRLMDSMAVERLGRSHLIQVAVFSSDPLKASEIANSFVETHIDMQRAGERQSREKEIAQLTDRVTALRADLREADSAVAQFRREHGLFTARPDSLNQAQMAQLTGALTQAR